MLTNLKLNMISNIINYLSSINPVLAALYATLFTWGVTALGAALVFFFKSSNKLVMDGMLGFTGGVMVAKSGVADLAFENDVEALP